MRNSKRIPWLYPLLIVLLAFSIAGCGDDDDPTGTNGGSTTSSITGTWVAYQGLENGQPEPDGGTYGAAGFVMDILANGSGAMYELSEPGEMDEFTWTVADGVITAVSDEYGSQVADYTLVGDKLTITTTSSSGTYSNVMQRYNGGQVLHGSWRFLSVMDDYQGIPMDEEPHTVQFRSDGRVIMTREGENPDTFAYSTDGPWMGVGPNPDSEDMMVFCVVGATLHLFQYLSYNDPVEGPIDVLAIWKYRKI